MADTTAPAATDFDPKAVYDEPRWSHLLTSALPRMGLTGLDKMHFVDRAMAKRSVSQLTADDQALITPAIEQVWADLPKIWDGDGWPTPGKTDA